MNEPEHDIRSVADRFDLRGRFLDATPYGNGHINDTYAATFDRDGTRARFIIQRINHNVFRNPPALMDNIQRVTAHLKSRAAGEPERNQRFLAVIPTRDGGPFYQDARGNYWRVYNFIEKARTYETVQSPRQAFEAAGAFGRFQRLLADLPAPRLHDTIPDFHHTPKRFEALETTIETDSVNRAGLAKPEIEFASNRKEICRLLLDANLPERVTHNDTKLNNVMLDDATGQGVCVIDLDTVMPGLAPYDFGDMVRTTTSPAREDERDLSKVTLQFPMFEALARGYLASAAEFLTSREKALLVFSAKLITFEIGIRFLADFLAGDRYFKVHRDGHNLDRCRTQFKLVESIERQEEQMNQLLEKLS